MLTQRKKRSLTTTHSRSRRHRSLQRRLAQFERLEDRRLLSVTVGGPHDPHFEFLDELREWRVERGAAITTELHHGPQGSFEFVWEPLPTALNTSADESGTGGESGSAGDLIPIASIPALHSNPGAPASLFLDFDGHFEPEWGAYSNATTPVYDIDGDVATFDETELSRILTAWEMVTEDFAPFNIDVTTVEPAVLADGVPDNQADGVAFRVAIGGSWEDWYGSSAGGVAYINSFTSSIPTSPMCSVRTRAHCLVRRRHTKRATVSGSTTRASTTMPEIWSKNTTRERARGSQRWAVGRRVCRSHRLGTTGPVPKARTSTRTIWPSSPAQRTDLAIAAMITLTPMAGRLLCPPTAPHGAVRVSLKPTTTWMCSASRLLKRTPIASAALLPTWPPISTRSSKCEMRMARWLRPPTLRRLSVPRSSKAWCRATISWP